MNLEAKLMADQVIGQSLTEAEDLCQENGVKLRLVERDGEHFIVTMDYRTDRVNVHVRDGIVTDARVG